MCHRLVLGVFLGQQNNSLNFHPSVRLVLLNPPGTTALLWHALIKVSAAAQDRSRCGVEDMNFAVAPRTGNVFALLGKSTLCAALWLIAVTSFFFPFILACASL